jgi:hypothetical protein
VLDLRAVKQRFLNNNAADLIALSYAQIPALKMLDKHRLAENVTNITQYHTPTKTMFTMIGTSIRDAYLNAGQTNGFFPPKYRENLEAMNRFFFQCMPANQGAKVDALLTFSHAIIPFLTKQELDGIWQVIQGSGCYDQLSSLDRQWIELLYSLSIGDAGTFSKVAKNLLAGPQSLQTGHGEFLVGSALLGDLLLNDQSAAASIWRQYHSQYHLNLQSNLLLRLVAAHNQLI